jgi:hypothetical protein
VQYIVESINKQNEREMITPIYKMTVNIKVRLIESMKTRYNLSSYYYMITDISRKSITSSRTDGSVKTITRLQIIPVDTTTKVKEPK